MTRVLGYIGSNGSTGYYFPSKVPTYLSDCLSNLPTYLPTYSLSPDAKALPNQATGAMALADIIKSQGR